MNRIPHRAPTGRIGVLAVAAASVLALVLGSLSSPAVGQSSSLSVFLAPEIPPGLTAQNLPTSLSLRAVIQVANVGAAAAVNQQIVLRLGVKPDSIVSVNDGTGNVGTIDAATGAWFHTIPSIGPGTTVIFTATWTKVCPGKWPMAVRVADKLSSLFATWVGPADGRCGADETASPQSAAYFQLAWPPTASVTTTLAAGATTTAATTTTAPTTTTTTVPGATTTTRLGSTTTAVITPVGASTTLLAPPPTVGGPTTTLLQLTLSTTTTTAPRPAATSRTATTAKPGTNVFCKTVGGKRYCGPKSSAYKPGQKKSVEVKPKKKKK